MRQPIPAPTPRPPRYGLIAAAPIVNDENLTVQFTGWKYAPEGCGPTGRGAVDCAGSTSVIDPTEGQPATIEGDPIYLWAVDECASFGYEARDWLGRARRLLTATESFQLAAEVWDGTITQAEGLENRWLAETGASSDTVNSSPADPVDALACIEAGLAHYLKGQQGMVHVTTQLHTHLVNATVVTREGQVWTTPNGHIVVADAGYSGAGPGGTPATTSQWMYGTPIIQVRLGPVVTTPESLAGAQQLASAMDRAVNDITVVAGRLAGFQWSSECAHVAARVDLATCLIGGAS